MEKWKTDSKTNGNQIKQEYRVVDFSENFVLQKSSKHLLDVILKTALQKQGGLKGKYNEAGRQERSEIGRQ